jgi:hypothetical protein
MNNNIQILYNNINLFSGLCPTPFVTTDQDFIDYNTGWNQVTKMTMNGQLTGRYLGQLSYYELTSGFNLLLNRLSNNYGSLLINENSETLFSGQNVVVDSITTDEDYWYGILPFTINFTIYETGLFQNYFGIIEPEENFDFSEEDGLIVNLTHKLSARGLNTLGKTAVENAKNWVLNRTGSYNKIFPIFIQTGIGSDFLLNSTTESIDRFNGTYSVNNQYTRSNSSEALKSGILNYTIDLSSGQDGFITVGLQGSFRNNQISGINNNNLRSGFLQYNFYNIANTAALQTFNIILNQSPVSQSVTEEQNNNVLNFNISYNNDLISNVINDYTVDIETDNIKNITNVNLNSKIFAKYGDVNNRWSLVRSYYTGSFNAFLLANTEYQKEIKNRILYSTPLTESVTFNEYNAEIEYNASWSDKRKSFSDNVLNMTSSVKYTPSVNIYASNTSAFVSREHNIQNLNCASLSILDISVSAISKPNKSINFAIEQVQNEINRIKSNYQLEKSQYTLLQDRNYTINDVSKSYSINEIWSFEGAVL